MSAAIRPTQPRPRGALDGRAQAARDFLCDHLGMHVIEETDTFTLVGVDAKLGKLTLFDAEGPRERGSIEQSRCGWATSTPWWPGCLRRRRRSRPRTASCASRARAACRWRSSSAAGRSSTSTTWSCACPTREAALRALESMGFERRDAGWRWPTASCGSWKPTRPTGERPLLNHIALLVESADEVQREAEERGVEVDDIKDAPNTFAVFLRGPSGVRIEYVEHKPGFALV